MNISIPIIIPITGLNFYLIYNLYIKGIFYNNELYNIN